jgi:hypothetical protein
VEGALRERRERPNLLDLVTEELDAQRLAPRRGEDVDDPAPHRELATFLDAFDTLVAGERERLGEAVDTGLVSHAQLDRRRSCLERWQPFRERSRRSADEPSARKDVEGAVALADQVRWRCKPRVERDTATGQ